MLIIYHVISYILFCLNQSYRKMPAASSAPDPRSAAAADPSRPRPQPQPRGGRGGRPPRHPGRGWKRSTNSIMVNIFIYIYICIYYILILYIIIIIYSIYIFHNISISIMDIAIYIYCKLGMVNSGV